MRISKRVTTKMISKNSLCCIVAVFLIISYIESTIAHKLRQRDTTDNGACAPLNIVNGDYNVLGFEYIKIKGGPIPNYAAVNITCNANYGLYPENSVNNICINGKWSTHPLQECRQLCPPRTSTSVKVTCTLDGKDVDCAKPVLDGTVAHSTCNEFYYQPYGGFPTSKCSGGSWNIPLIICEPECGQLIPSGETQVVGGHDAVRGKFPWHTGLYRFNAAKSTYDYQCGGSIVTPLIVITAAHCVTNHLNEKFKAEEFYVAAGKYYSYYDAPEDSPSLVQKRQVKEYKIPREYRAYHSSYAGDLAVLVIKQAFTLSNVVQPVCVDWNSDSEGQQLRPQKLGNVVGWGLIDPENLQASETLKQLTVPYIDRFDCLDAVPQDFIKWVTHDKFCAGFTNGSSVCKGDSGGGLVFKWMDNERNKIKFYLRGLVSVGPLKEKQCDNYKYGVYTKISSYIEFIRQVVVNINSVNTCISGECRQLCPPRISTAVKVTCTHDGRDVDCAKPVVEGTVAESRCNDFYTQSGDDSRTSKCSGGAWDKPLIRCEPECGQRMPSRRKRLVGANDAVRGEFPWHIALYRFNSTKSTYEYQCGGSIITPLIVITAARCVTSYFNVKYEAEEFFVAAGKYYSDYNAAEDNLDQKRQVKEYRLPREYKASDSDFEGNLAVIVLKEPFKLTNVVQPVCVDWNSDSEKQHLKPTELGYVSSYSNNFGERINLGLSSGVAWDFVDPEKPYANEILNQLTVPYIDRQECLDAVPQGYASFVTQDKFCAGWKNRSGVCDGDYGSGLVFRLGDNRKQKYYLRGLVSAYFYTCNRYGIYTKISAYIELIKQVVSENKLT